MTSSTTRHLLIKAKGGLGNRMLSACTGIVLAELTGRVAVIDWRDDDYLPLGEDAYPALFESPTDHRASDFDDRTDVTPEVWRGRLSEHPFQLISELYPDDHSNPFVYRRLSIDLADPEVPEPLAVFWSYLPKMARIRRRASRDPRFRGMRTPQLAEWALQRYFRPNDRVRSAVEALFSGSEGPRIGVHIRYTDRKVSLERVFRETRRLRARVPHAQIFLATDNAAVQAQFCEAFDDVLVIDKVLGDDHRSLHQDTDSDDPLREAENALIDMWALAACTWLIHSRHSTFSVAAALIGRIPSARQRDIDRWNPRVVTKRWVQTWA